LNGRIKKSTITRSHFWEKNSRGVLFFLTRIIPAAKVPKMRNIGFNKPYITLLGKYGDIEKDVARNGAKTGTPQLVPMISATR
jgi:hypothetical protein